MPIRIRLKQVNLTIGLTQMWTALKCIASYALSVYYYAIRKLLIKRLYNVYILKKNNSGQLLSKLLHIDNIIYCLELIIKTNMIGAAVCIDMIILVLAHTFYLYTQVLY